MAATFSKFRTLVPSSERSTTITSVEAGDKIDIKNILGRPARQIKIIPDHSTDVIEFKLNNLLRLRPKNKLDENQTVQADVEVWSAAPQFSTFSITGEDFYLTEEEVNISSIEIVDITFGDGGTEITIVVW